MGSISEGTYVSNIIVPAIRALLKNVPFEKPSLYLVLSDKVLQVQKEKGSS